MEFIKVTFTITRAADYQIDLLIDALGSIGFDTFNDTETGFEAYIHADSYNENELNTCIFQLQEDIEYSYVAEKVISENWNEAWERNFTPMTVKDSCYVRASFHPAKPEYTYEIVIDPKMAFGTGHHETTTMMMEYILENDMRDKQVLDMGCGTGILAILAAKRGAKYLDAIDYDPICYESTIENATSNNTPNVAAGCGGKEAIPDKAYDVILANINRNILLDQIPAYASVLKPGGSIFFSGFYESPDLDMIKAACAAFNIVYADHKNRGEWVAARFSLQS